MGVRRIAYFFEVEGRRLSPAADGTRAIDAGFRLVRIGDEVSTIRQTISNRLDSLLR